DGISEQLASAGVAAASPDEVRAHYDSLVERVARMDEHPVAAGPHAFRTTIVPQAIVARCARLMEPLYAAGFVVPALAVVLVAAVYWFGVMTGAELRRGLDAAALLPGYALFFVSLLVHEFGHAAACSRYRARPGEIGFTIYAIFPAFYSDVSSAWRLTQRQRIVVDLGGIYFQSVALAGYIGLFALTHWAPLKLAVLLILPAIIFNLNPFMKFDGYWVLTDALGVTNLAKERGKVLRASLRSLRGSPGVAGRSWVQRLVLCYAILTVAAWGYCIVGAILAFRWNAANLTSLLSAILMHRTVVSAATAFQLVLLFGTMFVIVFGVTRAAGQLPIKRLFARSDPAPVPTDQRSPVRH
ncbi:MAG TPA: hypothetical protein VN224_12100, partial [Xanthomonadales bacterium]|nr:hypothetical protein [Xanthomonadales bacterium]